MEKLGEEKGRIEVGREDWRGEGGELFKGVLGGRGGRRVEGTSMGKKLRAAFSRPHRVPYPHSGSSASSRACVLGIDSALERTSRLGEFGLAWAPLKDLAFPPDSAPPPS